MQHDAMSTTPQGAMTMSVPRLLVRNTVPCWHPPARDSRPSRPWHALVMLAADTSCLVLAAGLCIEPDGLSLAAYNSGGHDHHGGSINERQSRTKWLGRACTGTRKHDVPELHMVARTCMIIQRHAWLVHLLKPHVCSSWLPMRCDLSISPPT
jgi:hypothetical protein